MPTKLGQNFLTDKNIVNKIMASADLKPDDFVIEIGPGKGILTEELVKSADRVAAIELDKNLAEFLRNKFSANQNIEIIEGNILKINLSELAESYKLKAKSYKVIANIPYYITSPIIRLFLEADSPPGEMILMVQKEVAERITAKPGQMSLLAVSVQYYAEAKILFPVSRGSFYPVPEVDSAVIKITYNKQPAIHNKQEAKKFFRIARAGFSAKRKTLLNNLASSLHLSKKEVEEKLKAASIKPIARAQELSVEDWKKLTSLF